ncbi:MAG: DNA repair protein RadC [Dehalococcoidia bacterium]|nr:MAG: DNA repair protein RadC [Dehalococcoidia bacterium]
MQDAQDEALNKSREGHRARLRAKFLKSGLRALNDYEIIELLLTLGQPRKDCKLAAKEAIKRFKDLRGVLEALPEELEQIEGIGPSNSFGIKFVREAASEYLKQKALGRPSLNSEKAVFDYLYQSMSGLKKEVFRVLFLNSQNELLETEAISQGTVNASAVFAREVIERAIKHKATALIFVHNHPSGNTAPSQDDKAITRELVLASSVMNLNVLDHLIIGDNSHYSFAAQGLIQKYEAEVESMKRRSGT